MTVGAAVDPSIVITNIRLVGGVIIISFKGGELESAPTVTGSWTGTGNSSGTYTNSATTGPPRFYRVHRH